MIELPKNFPLRFTQSNGAYKELNSPNNQNLLSKIQYATKHDIDFLLTKLSTGQLKTESMPGFERSQILKKASSLILDKQEFFSKLIATEGGKPLQDARIEVERAVHTLNLCAEEALRIGGEVLPMERNRFGLNHFSYTQHEPIGPVLAISAFNHPLNLISHQVGCALASGNSVVLKPAPSTPLTAYYFEDVLKEAGLPEDILFIVQAEIPEIQMLISSPHIAYVTFIGSAKVGWNLQKLIAPGTRLNLEHGGIAPAIVRDDAILEIAASALVKGSFYHAGQVCISTQRIFVHKNIYSKFKELFIKKTEQLKTGDATLESTDVGPLIRIDEVKRIQEWIEEALNLGATLLSGNERLANGHFLKPTILENVPHSTKLMCEEVFGPVVCIESYENEDSLIDYLNSSNYSFEACLFTQDINSSLYFAKKIKTMTMVINDHNAYRVDWMPFAGYRQSGLGMGGVKYMMNEMVQLKQVIIKL
jgi:acyl-CoA reductase-like NAD-dependent aldehyde dehydrogenase